MEQSLPVCLESHMALWFPVVRNILVKQDSERLLSVHTGELATLPVPALLFLFLSQMTSVTQYVLTGNLF